MTVTPDTGYELATLTPSKNGGGDSIEVTEDNNGNKSFIMPDEEVTVSGTFDLRNIPVKLTVQNGDEASGAAALFTDSYEAAGENFTSKMNETFILSVACDENYTFAISGSTPVDFRDLSYDEKEGYIAQNPTADANTHLLKVTTPAIDSGDLTLTVNFRKIKLYTIFYQPTDQTVTAMWCKSGNDTGNFQIEMDSADSIGDKKVFSVHLSMPDDPAKIAFAATSEAVAEATMTNVKVKKSVGEASTWSNGFDGQFLVIGGNAKAVTAAFVNDVSALAVYDDETKTITGDGTGASYQITVCGADDSGNVTTPGAVTAPAAPTREGFTFVGWRGFEGTAPEIKEKIYQPGNTILISDNTIIGCEWTPIQPNVKLNLNGGTGGTAVNKVNYKDILNISQNPERNGLAFDG